MKRNNIFTKIFNFGVKNYINSLFVVLIIVIVFFAIIFFNSRYRFRNEMSTLHGNSEWSIFVNNFTSPFLTVATTILIAFTYLEQVGANRILKESNETLKKANTAILENENFKLIAAEIQFLETKDIEKVLVSFFNTVKHLNTQNVFLFYELGKLNYELNNFIHIYEQINLLGEAHIEKLKIKLSSIYAIKYRIIMNRVLADIFKYKSSGEILEDYNDIIDQILKNISFLNDNLCSIK